jgi:hypothetical protein
MLYSAKVIIGGHGPFADSKLNAVRKTLEHRWDSGLHCVWLHRVCKSDVWLTVHRNSVWVRKTN